MKDLDITIDDNNSIRILPIEKYTASQKLKGESTKFVSSKYLNNINRNNSVQRFNQINQRCYRFTRTSHRKGEA